MSDNWKHRSKGMKCERCMWFARKVADGEGTDRPFNDTCFGRCRRHAPTMNGFPAVFGDDWCGDHKLNENALG